MRLACAATYARGGFSLEARFEVEGSTVAVVGPSGAGKSTLLALLCGLLAPERGSLALDGRPLADAGRGIFVPPRERRIGLVAQRSDLFPHLTVAENLDVAERFARGNGGGVRRDGLVEALRLSPLLARKAAALSGGEAKRAQLARSLLNRPRLLLLDEPFAGLDEPLRHDVLGAILEARERTEVPLVVVTHRPSEAAGLGDAAVALSHGRVVAAGEPLDVLLRPDVLGAAHLAGLETLLEVASEPPRAAWGSLPLALELPGVPRGARAFVALGADDVLLARSAPATSARHAWSAVVESVRAAEEDRFVTLRPEGGGGTLLARVSREAAAELELAPGAVRTVLFKSSSLRPLGALARAEA